MGIDPNTHKPINDAVNGQPKDAANLSHMAQWETARLEAEARLVKETRLQLQNQPGSSSSSSQPSLTRLVLNKIPPRPSLPPCLDVLKAWQNSLPTNKSSTPTTDNTPKMHSMYAMMLATDDLESPTSTLSFPDTATLPTSKITKSNTTFGLINQSFLPNSSNTPATCDSGIMKEASDSEPWENTEQSLEVDDIMLAVEAFRSTGYNCNNYMEDLHNEDVFVYGSNENENARQQNLGVSNVGEGGSTTFEEKHYWETILDLVNNLP